MIELRKSMEGSGWINDYLEFTQWCESPDKFHLWTALWCIASVVGRKVYSNILGYKTSRIYPNVFIALVAESAWCRKGTAGKMGRSLVRKIPSVEWLERRTTPERIFQKMQELNDDGKDASVTLFCEELAQFIGTDIVKRNFVPDLHQWYDCEDEADYGTKTAGVFPLRDCCFNLLGCATPQFLNIIMPKEALGMGLEGRMLFVMAKKWRRPIAIPRKHMPNNGEMEKLEDDLVKRLEKMSKISGDFEFDQETEDIYEQWYERENRRSNFHTFFEPYHGRRHTHVIKTAILFALSRGSEGIITKSDFLLSIRALRTVEDDMDSALSLIDASDFTRHFNELRECLRRNAPITRSQLLQKFRKFDARRLTAAMKSLEDEGFVVTEYIGDGTSKKEIYRIVKDK